MNFTDTQLDEFVALYSKKTGVVLSRDEAAKKATSLVLLVRSLLRAEAD